MGTTGQGDHALENQVGSRHTWEGWTILYPLLPFSVLNFDGSGLNKIFRVTAESESSHHILQGIWELNFGFCSHFYIECLILNYPGHMFSPG